MKGFVDNMEWMEFGNTFLFSFKLGPTSRDKQGAQQNEKVIMFRYPGGVTTDLHDTGWESAHFSLRTRGHNWPFRYLDK